jgi:hypothetical protein
VKKKTHSRAVNNELPLNFPSSNFEIRLLIAFKRQGSG